MTSPLAPEPSPPRPRRRWLRLSLRGLMVLVVLIGGVAGWLAHTIRTQREAIAVVRAAQGTIRFDYQNDQVGVKQGRPVFRTEPAAPAWLRRWLGDELFQSVESVIFRDPASPEALAAVGRFERLKDFTLGDLTGVGEGLRHLRGLGRLNQVWLAGPGLTDVMLGDLAQVPSIAKLTVGSRLNLAKVPAPDLKSTATDEGFARLAGMPALETLEIKDCPGLTDAGAARLVDQLPQLRKLFLLNGLASVATTLPALARRHPDLQSLGLDFSGVTDDDLKAVEGMTQLQSPNLQNTQITDAGLAHLRPLKRLTGLHLTSTGVTDAGLKDLEGLTALEQLFLGYTQVADGGLVHLAGLTKLKRLDLYKTLITDAGMATVARITSLEQIGLSYLPTLTDAGLFPLQGLKKLRQIDVVETKVTPEGIATLKQTLPSLRVITQARRRPAPAPTPTPAKK